MNETQQDTQRREALASANRNALIALMQEFNLVIPARSFSDWRPTKRNRGEIPGFDFDLVILATNGVLAWFATPFNGDLFHGHIQLFSGKVETLYTSKKDKDGSGRTIVPRAKSKRAALLESL